MTTVGTSPRQPGSAGADRQPGQASADRQPGPATADQPLRIQAVTPEDVLTLVGAAAGALGLDWLVYERLLPLSGALGFWACWYVLFGLFYIAVASMRWNRLVVRDKVVAVLVSTGGIFATAVVVDQIGYSFVKSLPAIVHPNFWTKTMVDTAALQPLTSGGIAHAAVGSLEQLAIATLLSVPLGIAAAVFLAEVGGALARPVRTIVNAMTALPSIIAGLLVYALVVLSFGLGKCGLAAAMAISVVMLPTVTRASEVVLRVVPGTLREASFALGASHWRTVWKVILPTARSGLATAVVLAMARGVGETAPVLLVAGFSDTMNTNVFHGWQATLPTLIFNNVFVDGEYPEFVERAFGAGFALMLVVVVLFAIARFLGGKRPGELTRRQQRRLRREAEQP
jgi:phosphate transport system permease protein